MAPLVFRQEDHSRPRLQTGAIAGIAVVGSVVFLLILGLLFLLLRAVRAHRKLLEDLETRGISITRPNVRRTAEDFNPGKPSVLMKHAFIPYGAADGWRELHSREDVKGPMEAHGEGLVSPTTMGRSNWRRIPWPFSRRGPNGGAPTQHDMELDAACLPVITGGPRAPLETFSLVIPEPLLDGQPTVRAAHTESASPAPSQTADRSVEPGTDRSRLSRGPFLVSDSTSNLRPHPLYIRKSMEQVNTPVTKFHRPLSTPNIPSTPSRTGSSRDERVPRSQTRSRSVSLGSQKSGHAPSGPVPPLPAMAAKIDSSAHPKSYADRALSRGSMSSLASVSSSVLVSFNSPAPQSDQTPRFKEGANREWKNSLILGPRQIRDTFQSYGHLNNSIYYINPSQGSIKNPTRHSVDSSGKISRSNSFSSVPLGSRTIHSHSESRQPMRQTMTPSTASIQLFATPKRNSRFQVNANGSPVHKPPVSILKDVVMKQRIPTRQLSQASSRNSSGSSNGNPFQWDPSPMQSGKPSALQRSPNARKGHRRQNCVRISLDTPTILGGNSRSLSPVMHGIQEEASEFEVPKTWFASPAPACASRPLPSLPDTSTCEPRLNTATLRTSLMPSSPTLSLANFFQEQNRLSGPAAGSSSIRPSPQKHLSKSYTAAASLGTIPAFPSPVRSSQAQSILTPALSVSKSSTEITSSTSSPDTSDLISKNSISHEPPPKIKPSPDKTSPRRCVGRKLDTVQFQAFVSTTQSMNESKLETMDILNRNIFNLAIFGPSHRTRGESLVGSSPACSPKSTPLRKDKQGVQVPTPPTVEKASGNEVPLPGSHSTASLLPINDVLGDPPLAQSVLALRRMNSDVNDLWRSDRRYRRMKREESPALEVEKAEQDTGANWIGPVEINEGATNVAAGKERLLEIKEEEPSDNILIAKDRATALSELTFPDALRKATSEGSAIERRLNPAVFDSHRQSKPIHRTIWEDDKSFRPGNHPPSADSVAMPVQWLRNPTKSPPHLRPMARPSLANRKSSATPAKQPISPDRREASKENQPPNAPNAPVGGVSKDLERSEVARRRERDRMIKPVFHGTPKRSSLMRKSAMLTALTQMEGVEATEKEVGTPGSLYDREGFLVC